MRNTQIAIWRAFTGIYASKPAPILDFVHSITARAKRLACGLPRPGRAASIPRHARRNMRTRMQGLAQGVIERRTGGDNFGGEHRRFDIARKRFPPQAFHRHLRRKPVTPRHNPDPQPPDALIGSLVGTAVATG